MAELTFHHGCPVMVDHESASAIAAGQAVVVGVIPYVAHLDIAADASRKSALAARGGVYKGTAAKATAGSAKVYWDDTAKKLTHTPGLGEGPWQHFGFVTPDSSATSDGDELIVEHWPDGTAVSA